ncbi:MAG: hypothetical protein LBF90_03265 [Prevotellaceae bacterium]|nr:hypothetical protein [Prevotellaceae bacterium]
MSALSNAQAALNRFGDALSRFDVLTGLDAIPATAEAIEQYHTKRIDYSAQITNHKNRLDQLTRLLTTPVGNTSLTKSGINLEIKQITRKLDALASAVSADTRDVNTLHNDAIADLRELERTDSGAAPAAGASGLPAAATAAATAGASRWLWMAIVAAAIVAIVYFMRRKKRGITNNKQ